MRGIVMMLLWSWWLRYFWKRRYRGRWIVPLWGFSMFLWRQQCENKKVISLFYEGGSLAGGWLSVETVYRQGEKTLVLANPCWVSWDTRKDKQRSQVLFCNYLEEKKKSGVDYVVGCAHKRYTEAYWKRFLERCGYPFFVWGEYRLVFFLGEERGEYISEGNVRRMEKQDIEKIKADIEKKKGFVPLFSFERWQRELQYKGCTETWVYEKEGEILGWVNGWRYSYLEGNIRKRGFFLRWMEKERLSFAEKKAMITLLAREWRQVTDVVTLPDFVLGGSVFESMGVSEEKYVIFGVDLQGKGERKLHEFGFFFLF